MLQDRRRRSPCITSRHLLETLESRLLLSTTAIPIEGPAILLAKGADSTLYFYEKNAHVLGVLSPTGTYTPHTVPVAFEETWHMTLVADAQGAILTGFNNPITKISDSAYASTTLRYNNATATFTVITPPALPTPSFRLDDGSLVTTLGTPDHPVISRVVQGVSSPLADNLAIDKFVRAPDHSTWILTGNRDRPILHILANGTLGAAPTFTDIPYFGHFVSAQVRPDSSLWCTTGSLLVQIVPSGQRYVWEFNGYDADFDSQGNLWSLSYNQIARIKISELHHSSQVLVPDVVRFPLFNNPIYGGSYYHLAVRDDALYFTDANHNVLGAFHPEPVIAQGSNQLQVTANMGEYFSATVATFVDDLPDRPASSYSATINWGDGTSSPGTIFLAGDGTFHVTGSHKYEQFLLTSEGTYNGLFGLTVTVRDATPLPGSAEPRSVAIQAYVTCEETDFIVRPRAIIEAFDSLHYLPYRLNEPVKLSLRFSDSLGINPSQYTARIYWDPQRFRDPAATSTPTLSIDPATGLLLMQSEHTFTQPLDSTYISIELLRSNGYRQYVSVQLVPADAGLAFFPETIANPTTQPVRHPYPSAFFKDFDAGLTASDYQVTMAWGDGSTAEGQVGYAGPGAYSITLPYHLYDPGQNEYQFTLTVTASDGRRIEFSRSFLVHNDNAQRAIDAWLAIMHITFDDARGTGNSFTLFSDPAEFLDLASWADARAKRRRAALPATSPTSTASANSTFVSLPTETLATTDDAANSLQMGLVITNATIPLESPSANTTGAFAQNFF